MKDTEDRTAVYQWRGMKKERKTCYIIVMVCICLAQGVILLEGVALLEKV
jgi:t-SNARE complex subunit (syntaxin)